jgi:hypothetical protein
MFTGGMEMAEAGSRPSSQTYNEDVRGCLFVTTLPYTQFVVRNDVFLRLL